ncbi:folylpolyglutamate synthase, mitochondrial [Phlebotomus argentipes]|uniref:folylpolyglutamate synthase, mitochondrial n=1 Tax=Phlebotomus argentipes TaxID=94469 RepID=UPI002892BD1B|nr:folylpolyglutamate synthase, mitochondrial [Phlebotomus argentipes]XP_059619848.1 folylpolyglutamate synthase, mitochondrial [Phlebotomus argentipes]
MHSVLSIVGSSIWCRKMVFDAAKSVGIVRSLHIASESHSIVENYEEAVKTLNTLQSNAETIQQTVRNSNESETLRFKETEKFLDRIGVPLERLDTLSVIHVAGTKGKGSTCALVDSILQSHGIRTGFFSSPHLISATERIRLNGIPISEENFVKYFWRIYNQLRKSQDHDKDMPTYFKFLTIMAFNVFLEENVDVAIVEVGIGGEYDCTNIVRHTKTVGITSLGLDHTHILGNSLEEIAWQKAGIIKPKSHVFTVNQPSGCLEVIEKRAQEKKAILTVVPDFSTYTFNHMPRSNVETKVQRLNTSLAIQLSNDWLQHYRLTRLPRKVNLVKSISEEISLGIENTRWPGRCQMIPFHKRRIFLDGAHTVESIQVCAEWFADKTVKNNNPKCLIFNVTGCRDSKKLLKTLLEIATFSTVLFTPNIASNKYHSTDNTSVLTSRDEALEKCRKNEKDLFDIIAEKHSKYGLNGLNGLSKLHSQVLSSVSDAFIYLDGLHGRETDVDVLITGSLYLVGASLLALEHVDVKN